MSVVSVKVSSSSEAKNETAARPTPKSISSTELPNFVDSTTGKNSASEATVAENREPKLVDVKPQLITSTTEPLIMTTTSEAAIEATTTTTTAASKRLARVKYEHISDETTSTIMMVTSDEDLGIPRLIDNRHQGHEADKAGITSETARALGELGFEYKEYMDDSSLLGEESNDEVIPAFDEEAYEQPRVQDNDLKRDDVNYSNARAVPSTSEQVFEDEAEAEYATSRQQSKKAPLPHQYEPSTIIGITIGAFLLIFIGTG